MEQLQQEPIRAITQHPDRPRLFSIEAAGQMAGGLSNQTIWRRIADGTLKAVKVGRRTAILAASLHAWIDAIEIGEWVSPDKFHPAKKSNTPTSAVTTPVQAATTKTRKRLPRRKAA